MNIQNQYLPADRQNIDNLDTECLEIYLLGAVDNGYISKEDAQNIIDSGKWYKVINLADRLRVIEEEL